MASDRDMPRKTLVESMDDLDAAWLDLKLQVVNALRANPTFFILWTIGFALILLILR